MKIPTVLERTGLVHLFTCRHTKRKTRQLNDRSFSLLIIRLFVVLLTALYFAIGALLRLATRGALFDKVIDINKAIKITATLFIK